MSDVIELHSARLRLRTWIDGDLEPLAALCADSRVMRYFPSTLGRDEVAAALTRIQAHFDRHGFGFWALEHKADGAFVGFTGLAHVGFQASFAPAVEIGWRLAPAYWGRGLASEAARAVLACGFERLGLAEVVSFTALDNLPSRRVMQAIGMREEADFDHPGLPPGHALRRHALYRLLGAQWRSQR